MRYSLGSVVSIAAVGTVLLAGCSTADSTPAATPLPSDASASVPTSPPAVAPDSAESPAGSAAAALAALPITDAPAAPGYSRQAFGRGWADADGNGCDARTDILRRDLVDVQSSGACTIVSGTLHDPYTATTVEYVRGGRSEVDIDHVVALSNAWRSGADRFPASTRVALANDPLNLLAVDAGTNRAKGDGDAAEWMVPAAGFRCRYVARQIAVKTKYHLTVTTGEADAMRHVLSACPGEPVPASGAGASDLGTGFGEDPDRGQR